MRPKMYLGVIFVLLFPIVSYAQKGDNSRVRELYVKCGMEKQTEQLPSVMQALLDQSDPKDDESQKLPRGVLSVMRATIPKAFAPERLREVMLAEIAKKLPDNDITEVLRWLDSPLGKKCTQLEEASSTAEAQSEMQKFAAGLTNSPPTAERLIAIRELDSAVKITESAVDMAINMQIAVALGMMATLPSEQQKRADDVARELEQTRPNVEATVKSETLISNLYTYRSLSEAEIKQYTAFAKSPVGSKYSLAAIAALKKALNEGAARWGKLIGEATKGMQGSTEA